MSSRLRLGITLVETLAALVVLSLFVAMVSAWTPGAARLAAKSAASAGPAAALAQVEALLRADLAERPLTSVAASRGSLGRSPRGEASEDRPLYGVRADPDAASLVLVTKSSPAGDTETAGPLADELTGWHTVAWRYDAARRELLRGSWTYSPQHAASPPLAERSRPGVRVALSDVRSFDVRQVTVTHGDAGPGEAPTTAWVATITTETRQSAHVVIAMARREESR